MPAGLSYLIFLLISESCHGSISIYVSERFEKVHSVRTDIQLEHAISQLSQLLMQNDLLKIHREEEHQEYTQVSGLD